MRRSAPASARCGGRCSGANEAVINTLERIVADGGGVQKWVDRAKDPNDSFRLAGFGHRVYKNTDPRATIIKAAADRVLHATGADEELFDVAQRLEEVALRDEYFIERKLYPNVDFYSGLIYRAIGFPKNMFTNCFAIGRLPGWIAQWREMLASKETKIGRPRQVCRAAAASIRRRLNERHDPDRRGRGPERGRGRRRLCTRWSGRSASRRRRPSVVPAPGSRPATPTARWLASHGCSTTAGCMPACGT